MKLFVSGPGWMSEKKPYIVHEKQILKSAWEPSVFVLHVITIKISYHWDA